MVTFTFTANTNVPITQDIRKTMVGFSVLLMFDDMPSNYSVYFDYFHRYTVQ